MRPGQFDPGMARIFDYTYPTPQMGYYDHVNPLKQDANWHRPPKPTLQ